LAMSVAPENGRNRILIYGPKNDGTYIVEFRTADGEALAISVPAGETVCSSTSRSGCPMGCSCRTFREKERLGLLKKG
jgi:adenine C2-methylase RlmN of 23S rRNA A2503 and tRNA A37